MTQETLYQIWCKTHGYTITQAAEALGICRSHSHALFRGQTGANPNRPARLTKTMALAMAAVEHGLDPVSEDSESVR